MIIQIDIISPKKYLFTVVFHMCCCLMYEIKVGEWPLQIAVLLCSFWVLHLFWGLPPIRGNVSWSPRMNAFVSNTQGKEAQLVPQNPLEQIKSNWENPWILFHTHIITILFVQNHRIFLLCPVVFRSSVRRGKRRYGVCRMGKGRILTASRGANLTTTCGKRLETLHVLRCCFFILSKNL